jgi:hypothetical protein
MVLNKGDKAVLKVSKRPFFIIDERKSETNEYEELCQFIDDPRHPVWIHYKYLRDEVRYPTDDERKLYPSSWKVLNG